MHRRYANKVHTKKGYYEVYWRNPRSKNPWNNSCMATHHPSQKYQSKTNKTCCIQLEKENQTHSRFLLWTPTYGRACVGRPARTYMHQVCVDTEYSLEDLPGVMDDRDGWRETETGTALLTAQLSDGNILIKIRRSTKIFVFFEFIYFVLTYVLYIYVCFQLVAFVREHMWYKALLMGYSMRLELTLVFSINDLCLVRLIYIEVVVPLSWSVFTLVCFTRLW